MLTRYKVYNTCNYVMRKTKQTNEKSILNRGSNCRNQLPYAYFAVCLGKQKDVLVFFYLFI